jgi:hypothetical protein
VYNRSKFEPGELKALVSSRKALELLALLFLAACTGGQIGTCPFFNYYSLFFWFTISCPQYYSAWDI